MPPHTRVFHDSSLPDSSSGPGNFYVPGGDVTSFVLWAWMASSHFFLLLSSSSRRSNSKAFCKGDRALHWHLSVTISC